MKPTLTTVWITLCLFAGPCQTALADGEDCGTRLKPSTARLPVQTPAVSLISWDARRGRIPTPAEPPLRADPMQAGVTNVYKGTRLQFLRQKQSNVAKISGCIDGNCDLLKDIARGAVQWDADQVLEMETDADVPAAQNIKVLTQAQKVWRPHTIVQVRAVDKHGQSLPSVVATVKGLAETQGRQMNAHLQVPPQAENIVFSGRNLPPAAAWIKKENLYVSEQTENHSEISEGTNLLQSAKNKRQQIETLNAGLAELTGDALTQSRAMIRQLSTEVGDEESRGNALLTSGRRPRVQVLSLAALPAANTRVDITHPRLAGQTIQNETDTETGYLMADVFNALQYDELQLQVRFPGQQDNAGAARESRATIRFSVPDNVGKPAFVFNGVKFYAVQGNVERFSERPELP